MQVYEISNGLLSAIDDFAYSVTEQKIPWFLMWVFVAHLKERLDVALKYVVTASSLILFISLTAFVRL
jgi:hypothetical protein